MERTDMFYWIQSHQHLHNIYYIQNILWMMSDGYGLIQETGLSHGWWC